MKTIRNQLEEDEFIGEREERKEAFLSSLSLAWFA
jgi:hypothetical protein